MQTRVNYAELILVTFEQARDRDLRRFERSCLKVDGERYEAARALVEALKAYAAFYPT